MSWGIYPVVRVFAMLLQVPALGSDAEDRARLAQLLGASGSENFLLRLDSGRTPFGFALTTVYNSTLPFSLNDGALWAGRGWSQVLQAGFGARWGRVTLVLAPALVSTQNRAYEMPGDSVQLPRPPGRSDYSTPWHVGAYSIDLPLRFGSGHYTRLDPGQST